MILFDGVHLVSDTSLGELHAFAGRMGLKREWFQDKGEIPHYDVTGERIRNRIYQKATQVSKREIVQKAVRA